MYKLDRLPWLQQLLTLCPSSSKSVRFAAMLKKCSCKVKQCFKLLFFFFRSSDLCQEGRWGGWWRHNRWEWRQNHPGNGFGEFSLCHMIWIKPFLCLTAKCYEKLTYYKSLDPSDLMIDSNSSYFKVITRDILSTLLIIPIKNVLDEIHQVFASRISHPVTLSWHHQRLKMNFPSSPSWSNCWLFTVLGAWLPIQTRYCIQFLVRS